ncbi:MAG: aspartate--tRNA(Asn) ligase [Candidatus Obscuribacterales bacterium]|nr:aspartate--tRNA(Asn) ligase [Candidatus Obscuribacterales bacterium]
MESIHQSAVEIQAPAAESEFPSAEEAASTAGQSQSGLHCLHGHVYALRRFGSLLFIVLRSRKGLEQIVVDKPELLVLAESLSCETAIRVRGNLMPKPGEQEVSELHACEIELLSTPNSALPVEISREKRMQSLSLNALMEYRPLTLRNEKVRAIFKIEAEFCRAFREFLCGQEFTEIHSPKIVSTGTEGGASLFSIDYFEKKAYLAQSPQFYKQMMVAVYERVFEIGPVYRAEEHNTARHLNEYISMDFEMGFIESEAELMAMQTRLLKHMFVAVEENCAKELALFSAKVPKFEKIPQLKLAEAVEILARKLGWKGEGNDLDPEGERLLFEYIKAETGSELVYLTHYPWKTRPFYAMPEKGSQASHSFDLLYKGLEITTGGQRIHRLEELEKAIFERGMPLESFGDYLQCFRYGMPPHGGLAIGLERIAKQLLDLKNVRQAALFPRDRTRISP